MPYFFFFYTYYNVTSGEPSLEEQLLIVSFYVSFYFSKVAMELDLRKKLVFPWLKNSSPHFCVLQD